MSKEAVATRTRTRKRVEDMTPEEREAYEKRAAAARAPKPLYIAYRVVDASGNVIEGAKIDSVVCTRSADELLKTITEGNGIQYVANAVK